MAVAAVACTFFAGCTTTITGPGGTTPAPADVYAVVAPDSLAVGQPLAVKMEVFADCCAHFEPFVFHTIDPSTVELRPEVTGPVPPCGCPVGPREVTATLDLPPAGSFTVRVVAEQGVFVAHVGGAPAAPIERHRFEVLDAVDSPAIGVRIVVAEALPDSLTSHVLLDLTTDAHGVAEAALPCPPSGERVYSAEVTPPGSPGPILTFVSTARCGVPERALVRLPAFR